MEPPKQLHGERRHEPVEPLDVDGTRTVAVGAGVWLIALLVLLPFYETLQAGDRLWWLGTCLAGFLLGVGGWRYCLQRKRRRG